MAREGGRPRKVDVRGLARAAGGNEAQAKKRADMVEWVRSESTSRGIDETMGTDYCRAYDELQNIICEAEERFFPAVPHKNRYGDEVRGLAERRYEGRLALVRSEVELLQDSERIESTTAPCQVHGAEEVVHMAAGAHAPGSVVGRIALWLWRACVQIEVAEREIRKRV